MITRSIPKEVRNVDLLSPPHVATTLLPANFASCIFRTKGHLDFKVYEIFLKIENHKHKGEEQNKINLSVSSEYHVECSEKIMQVARTRS